MAALTSLTPSPFLLFFILALPDLALCSLHTYSIGDPVPLYANKVGPFCNPSETYRYFDLPFCSPGYHICIRRSLLLFWDDIWIVKNMMHLFSQLQCALEISALVMQKREDLGELLNGDRMVQALYRLNFREDKTESLCKKTLTKENVQAFREAIKKDYYFQMYYDDLPIWGFIGRVDELRMNYFMYTHIHFSVSYNKDRVIEISVASDTSFTVNLTVDREVEVEFGYDVKWTHTGKPYERRLERYAKHSFLPQNLEIQWFSILNSCVTVLLLTGFLAIRLRRVLNKNAIRYAQDEEAAGQEESGWRCIHGDVFRYPTHKSLFCAVLGSGSQLLAVAMIIFTLALVGVFYPYNRGALSIALVVTYTLTSGIAGYSAASFYQQLDGSYWVHNLVLTGCLFCGPLFLTFCFLNTTASAYNATAALPLEAIVVILVWTLVAFALLVLGGIIGKNSKAKFQAPCHTSKLPREIPLLPWYRQTVPQMAVAGFLPFSGIHIELYYIVSSIWGHKVYTIYGILFIVFIILMIVTAFTTISLTYFQLAVEDHEWWWRAVLYGGSTGIFVFGYCFYYYFAVADMAGFMQTSFFFGYMACVCYGLFLMLGTVGFRASLLFVQLVYRSIEDDKQTPSFIEDGKVDSAFIEDGKQDSP